MHAKHQIIFHLIKNLRGFCRFFPLSTEAFWLPLYIEKLYKRIFRSSSSSSATSTGVGAGVSEQLSPVWVRVWLLLEWVHTDFAISNFSPILGWNQKHWYINFFGLGICYRPETFQESMNLESKTYFCNWKCYAILVNFLFCFKFFNFY